jgi:hypothetical protein
MTTKNDDFGTKYDYLVKTLNFQSSPERKSVRLMGKDMSGLNLNLIWEYSNHVGAWSQEQKGHCHPYGECLVFTGFDYDHPNDLGAKIEIAMGEEGEKHTFDTATAIALPPGLLHNPTTTIKATRAYGVMVISLHGESKTQDVPVRIHPEASGSKFTHLVKNLELKDIHRTSGGNADIIAGWNGNDIEGINLNFTWAFHKGTGLWHEKDPHVHPYDEVLLFVGTDPANPEYLGAEIEIALGEEQEKHIFTKPTLVVAPKGLVHCPLNTLRVDKPYCFSAICLNNEHVTTWLGSEKK